MSDGPSDGRMTGGSRVAEGRLARLGLIDPSAAEELLARVAQSGVETVRIVFPDQHGLLRGKTVVASALGSALRGGLGVPSTVLLKDTSNRTVFDVWSEETPVPSMRGAGDVLMVPDPATFRVVPWSPHSAWILADVVHGDGTPVAFASRTVLARAVEALAAQGMTAKMGLEVEFMIFRRTDAGPAHSDIGMPGAPPATEAFAHGYRFLGEGRYDEAEPILDELRRAAQAMGMPVRSVEVEFGPNQYEMVFDPAPPMEQADTMVLFRAMVKDLCARRGLHATFMTRPRFDNLIASGWHVHQSVECDGRNLFIPGESGTPGAEASGWIAGLLEHAAASCPMIAPTVNSYKRYQPFQLAPNRIAWAKDNRGAMLRALMMPGDGASRIENRAPDGMANPHYAFASQIHAGLDGVTRGLSAPDATLSPYADDAPALPTSLGAALDALDGSAFYRQAMGDEVVDYLCTIKRAEWSRYLASVSEWEQAEYFGIF